MIQLFTFKAQSFYGAYAADADICSYGSCFEEAVNTLTDELRARAVDAAKADRDRSGDEQS